MNAGGGPDAADSGRGATVLVVPAQNPLTRIEEIVGDLRRLADGLQESGIDPVNLRYWASELQEICGELEAGAGPAPAHLARIDREQPVGEGPILVRGARADDAEALHALYTELTGEEPTALPGDLRTTRAALGRVLAAPDRHLLVAELSGRVEGTADLAILANVTHRGTGWGIVENVVVASRAQRRGLATALFAEIERIARDAGCHKLALLSGKHREEAHAFYGSLGYRAVSEGFKLYFDR